ncbi:MAG: PEP-CTERM sorting domain-containing protein [Opitutaceae bacterium]|jgi:hypothetical protein
MKKSLLVLLASVSAFAGYGYAVVLSGSVNIDPATSATLTSANTLDWAIWNTTSSTAVGSISATNTKSGGGGLISAITPFATTAVSPNNVRGVGGATEQFSYTDGSSPTSQTNATFGFVTNSTLATAGQGVQTSITGNASQLYRVDVWTAGFAGRGEMRASLNGASMVTLFSETFGTDGVNKASNLFSFFFMPDSNSDLLSLSFHLMSSPTPGASAHVGIQAITVSAVPEPATYAMLLGVGGLAFALVKRRRSF